MKKIIILLLIAMIPFSSILSKNVQPLPIPISKKGTKLSPPVEKRKKTKHKKKPKIKLKKHKGLLDIQKTQNRVPIFSIMLALGASLMSLGVWLILWAFICATSGLGIGIALFFAAILLSIGLVASVIAAIFIAKGLRENKSFRDTHQKTIRVAKKEIREEADKKVYAFMKKERRQYIYSKMRIYKLEANIALKKNKKKPNEIIIKQKEKAIQHHKRQIEKIEHKLQVIENHKR